MSEEIKLKYDFESLIEDDKFERLFMRKPVFLKAIIEMVIDLRKGTETFQTDIVREVCKVSDRTALSFMRRMCSLEYMQQEPKSKPLLFTFTKNGDEYKILKRQDFLWKKYHEFFKDKQRKLGETK